MRHLFTRLFTALALTLTLIGAASAQTFPEKTGPVVDEANLLDADARLVLTHAINRLANKTQDQLAVVTVKSIGGQDIETYARALALHWQLGEPGRQNGALVLVADDVGKVAIQVGDSLRTSLTDAMISIVLNNRILPQMRDGKLGAGIVSGVDSMASILTSSFENGTRGQTPTPFVVEKSPFDDYVLYFVLTLMGLVVTALAITMATQFGWLPQKRTGAWRILDAIVWLAGSFRTRTTVGSSSGSSSSRGYSGGGGTMGGGGSSGSW